MRELVGITPPDDRLGCLQDIHWPGGAIAYFPCYTLGALMAAQLFQAIERTAPEALSGIADGEFRPLLAWLRANIHEQGARYDTQTLLTRVTGRPLELQPFLDHLHRRYLAG
jgi:carboxypeptidase Taq